MTGRNESANSLTRREALTLMAGAAAYVAPLVVLAPGRSAAQSSLAGRTIVFAAWGGFAQDAQKMSICDPFAAKTGATVVQDGPMNNAKFLAMVQGGAPEWDVADVTIDFLHSNAPSGVFEALDITKVDPKGIDPKYVHPNGIGAFVWSYNLGFNTRLLAEGERPATWSDLFDLEKFPGQRSLRDRITPMMEIALLADGVDPKNLYPLDIERAFKKLDTIKEHAIWWTTNAQSQQLITDGQVSLGIIVNGRAFDAASKGGEIGIAWDRNIQSVDYWVIPKGSANVDAAQLLIHEMTLAENQARLADLMAYSPTNPGAFELIDERVRPWLSTMPENAAKGVQIDPLYWTPKLKELTERWEAWKLA